MTVGLARTLVAFGLGRLLMTENQKKMLGWAVLVLLVGSIALARNIPL